ncbi:hypothetical protein KIH86_20170 [Paenibacillus sp. HN-1]|uniref:hypothetical protein n=1 Tax=Paenibacillus TaxID=44249 RepID=UPI001CA92A67|nr:MULTISPECIES: hypothetical protein [Paenibacillus]MBY9081806.1 hypothetical protein [Paenibacillus sp. CGMCC 1.18879]MBY9086525.1 hypothetical protein [Paenibacillus sinensis]
MTTTRKITHIGLSILFLFALFILGNIDTAHEPSVESAKTNNVNSTLHFNYRTPTENKLTPHKSLEVPIIDEEKTPVKLLPIYKEEDTPRIKLVPSK